MRQQTNFFATLAATDGSRIADLDCLGVLAEPRPRLLFGSPDASELLLLALGRPLPLLKRLLEPSNLSFEVVGLGGRGCKRRRCDARVNGRRREERLSFAQLANELLDLRETRSMGQLTLRSPRRR